MTYIKFSAPNEFVSAFNPVVGFSPVVHNKIEKYIEERLDRFFASLGVDISTYEFLEIADLITDKEFQNTSGELSNSYFYKFLFKQPEKGADGAIQEPTKFTLTFDRDLTPLSIDDISYGTIKLSNRVVMYYILIDLQALIRISKS